MPNDNDQNNNTTSTNESQPQKTKEDIVKGPDFVWVQNSQHDKPKTEPIKKEETK